jgi:cystathionine beta-synthase
MSLVDDFVTVSDKESFTMARRLTREEGLFVGGSSGLIAHVALALARRLDDPGACVVLMLPDTGERYLSKLYSDEWMRENQLLDADRTTLATILTGKRNGDHPVISVGPGTTVRQALRLMDLHDVSQLPVLEGANSVGSVADWSLSAKSLADTKLLESTVGQVMDPPFPTVDGAQSVDAVAKLLSKANPAVLVRTDGKVSGIVTRSDMLNYLMGR